MPNELMAVVHEFRRDDGKCRMCGKATKQRLNVTIQKGLLKQHDVCPKCFIVAIDLASECPTPTSKSPNQQVPTKESKSP